MKIKEPIKKRCPHCGTELEFWLEWILQEGQVCQFCHHNLNELRLSFRHLLETLAEQWRNFANITEMALAIEDEFSICFDDQDLYQNEYEMTVSHLIEFTNRLLNKNRSSLNDNDLTTQILKIARKMFPNEQFKIELQTKLSNLGKKISI